MRLVSEIIKQLFVFRLVALLITLSIEITTIDNVCVGKSQTEYV